MKVFFTAATLFCSMSLMAQDFNMNINIQVDDENVNMNMDVQEDGGNVNMNINHQSSEQHQSTQQHQQTHTETQHYHSVEPAPQYESAPACPALDDMEFSEFISSMEGKSFEDSKLSMAKQMLKHNCVYSKQVKKIMRVFSFEDSKVEFAIAAYEKTLDQNKYYLVHDAFNFEMSIEELNEAIE